jgi:hypothetical protein
MAEQAKGIGSFFGDIFGCNEAFLLFLILILLVIGLGGFGGSGGFC